MHTIIRWFSFLGPTKCPIKYEKGFMLLDNIRSNTHNIIHTPKKSAAK